ncbi:MAG TPA: universal stress protein [Flavobacteriales bacterium]|nr:universal stress protein [Flavobacteriales bacterium]
MKTILVPTDFSEAAKNAADYAAGLAKDLKARIILLNVSEKPIVLTEVPGKITDPDKLTRACEESLKNESKRLAQTGVDVKYHLRTGFLSDEILEDEKNASLVVMGLKGTSNLDAVVIGSMTTSVLHKSSKPVLVIPDQAKYIAPTKIVFACDYSPSMNVNALNALKEFIKPFDSVVYVVNIREEEELIEIDHQVNMKLEHKLANVKHIYSHPRTADIAEGINKYVNEHNASMVVVVPHHYNLVDRIFHKSMSKKIALHTHVPLLALPEKYASLPGYML